MPDVLNVLKNHHPSPQADLAPDSRPNADQVCLRGVFWVFSGQDSGSRGVFAVMLTSHLTLVKVSIEIALFSLCDIVTTCPHEWPLAADYFGSLFI